MEWVLYASLAVVALAFALLAVYIAKTLTVLQETLRRLTEMIGHTDEQVQAVAGEMRQLLQTANGVAHDVQKNVHALSGVVEAVGETGEALKLANRALRQTAATLLRAADSSKMKWWETLQKANVFRKRWAKWRRKQSGKEVEINGQRQ
ncbi:DUF948 domain-containing protein [Caldibacillus thermoamylovorans]